MNNILLQVIIILTLFLDIRITNANNIELTNQTSACGNSLTCLACIENGSMFDLANLKCYGTNAGSTIEILVNQAACDALTDIAKKNLCHLCFSSQQQYYNVDNSSCFPKSADSQMAVAETTNVVTYSALVTNDTTNISPYNNQLISLTTEQNSIFHSSVITPAIKYDTNKMEALLVKINSNAKLINSI